MKYSLLPGFLIFSLISTTTIASQSKYSDRNLEFAFNSRKTRVDRIHKKYKAGPRMRFDILLDGSCQQYYPCWDTTHINPLKSVCNSIQYGSHQSGALISARNNCHCTLKPNYECHCSFPNNDCVEKKLIDLTIEASNYVSQVARKEGHDFNITPIELYLLFIMEGAYFPVAANQTCDIHGFGYLGIDNLLNVDGAIKDKYKPWSHPNLITFVAEQAKTKRFTNERYESVYSVSNFNLDTGIYAFAATYGYYKAFADKVLQSQEGYSLRTLPRRGQIFWAYVYFNSGEDSDVDFLVERFDLPWEKKDNFGSNRRSALFNSKVRVSTYVYIKERCISGDDVDKKLCDRLE